MVTQEWSINKQKESYMRKLFTILLLLNMIFLSCQSNQKDEKIDHIILGINDLEKGISQFKELTGVTPVFGGVHPNSFTQNALVSLENQAYIEILAPRSDLDSIPNWIMEFEDLTPCGWAVTSKSIDITRSKLLSFNYIISDPISGSRDTPLGDKITWTTFGFNDNKSYVFPFFINWDKNVLHPSENAPKGCRLSELQLFSNDNSLTKLSNILNIDLDVIKSPEDKIILRIRTPKGDVTFPNKH